jgi:UDP:flavonoid glycosyltransferase YjiC (YdhE family)
VLFFKKSIPEAQVHLKSAPMSRILLSTIGSLGDLHPLIAIGLELHRRGHEVRFCTSETYRAKLESLGFGFDPLRPDLTPENDEAAGLVREIMDPKRGAERLVRGLMMPQVEATYADLLRAATGPPRIDLLVSGELVYAAPVLAQKLGLKWATYITAPMSFFSAHDPPVLPPVPQLVGVFRRLGPGFNAAVIRLIKLMTRNWSEPVRQLRRKLGLPPGDDPIYEGKFSPQLVLAIFSAILARPQPDWPPNTVVTGFPFYDGVAYPEPLPPLLAKFIKAGEPPIVFTLGSSAVLDPGGFYHHSAEAARLLKRRAVLLIGRNPPPPGLPEGVTAFEYVRFSELFPHAAAIVHQGGVGTTGQALLAGRPMLIMPYNFDQPDNAARIVRLGVGRVLSRALYSAKRASRELEQLLDDTYQQRSRELASAVSRENGAALAANSLERLLT